LIYKDLQRALSNLGKKEELDDALQKFEENIKKKFPDPRRITWIDENTMFIIRKESD